MKSSTQPSVPPALRKANPNKAADISTAFPPIVARPRPEPPPPAPAAETPAPPSAEPAPPTPTPEPIPAPAPLVRPVGPSKPLPPVKPVLAAPITRPKPVITGRPPVAVLDGKVVLFEGTFRSDENPSFTVETPLTGNAAKDRQALINIARRKYPTGRMELKSTRIFTREKNSVTSFPPGATLNQLFGPTGSPTEVAVELGSVFFDSAICQIFLRNLRSRNCVTFSLRQPNGGTVNFSNQIQSNRLAKELPIILREILGNKARELNVTLKEEVK